MDRTDKIIQIVITECKLYGLSENGYIYSYSYKCFGKSKDTKTWILETTSPNWPVLSELQIKKS